MTTQIPSFPTDDFESAVIVSWYPAVSGIKQIIIQDADYETSATMFVNMGVPNVRGKQEFRFRLTLTLEAIPPAEH